MGIGMTTLEETIFDKRGVSMPAASSTTVRGRMDNGQEMRGTTVDASGPLRIRLGWHSCQSRRCRRLVQQLRYSQSGWSSFWGLHRTVNLDFDATGHLIGIEIQGATKVLSKEVLNALAE
jgi:hypothetical protein